MTGRQANGTNARPWKTWKRDLRRSHRRGPSRPRPHQRPRTLAAPDLFTGIRAAEKPASVFPDRTFHVRTSPAPGLCLRPLEAAFVPTKSRILEAVIRERNSSWERLTLLTPSDPSNSFRRNKSQRKEKTKNPPKTLSARLALTC